MTSASLLDATPRREPMYRLGLRRRSPRIRNVLGSWKRGRPIGTLVRVLCLLAIFTCTHSPLGIQVLVADDGVEEAQRALESKGNFPWYDEKNDTLAPPKLSKAKGSSVSHRDSSWERQERTKANNPTNPNAASTFSTLATVFFWLVVILLFATLVGFLVWAFMKQETSIHHDDVEDWLNEDRTDEQRIEDLPFEIKQPKSNLLAAAQAARDRGDHRQAIIYLFSYMLIQLDRAHLIRLAKGKTNRQYLGELPYPESLKDLVERTMVTFERVFFGDHELQSGELNERWDELDEFHQLVDANQR